MQIPDNPLIQNVSQGLTKMLKFALTLAVLICSTVLAQAQGIHWAATTGDVSLSSSGMSATVQQPASGAQNIEMVVAVVYCSVACTVTQSALGTAATATAGTIVPIIPGTAAPTATFWTASNVGAGTAQGGAFHLSAASTQLFCLNASCGAAATVRVPTTGGTASNYTVTVSSISGTANITIYGRSY